MSLNEWIRQLSDAFGGALEVRLYGVLFEISDALIVTVAVSVGVVAYPGQVDFGVAFGGFLARGAASNKAILGGQNVFAVWVLKLVRLAVRNRAPNQTIIAPLQSVQVAIRHFDDEVEDGGDAALQFHVGLSAPDAV